MILRLKGMLGNGVDDEMIRCVICLVLMCDRFDGNNMVI